MPTFNGLPLHPLVVHAVVVLLPLAVLGVTALAVRPALADRFGSLIVGVAALATVSIPVATSTGEDLEHRVGDPGAHAHLGDTLIWFAIPLLAVAVALVWTRRRARTGPAGRGALGVTLSVLALVVAAANLVQVYRVGDSGARAVWDRTPAVSTRGR
ncbi:hypothetical protein Daura_18005 [Dactylosporangium aurantiacum]|uniref:DUF2231 domain-containing protein n=1 Tax=Dactylosporangium aurantiacum TaxID=35754 RepID=A0A9Q9MG41_9ACTN|nr:DUF2231 domain-containing protein [Dactylosporangium aurantiacum]MDG6105937.1 hypothetical protein [Dactylosporangium aurantiacum]UWZ57893.1 hypothetical protein Daura_18005 [Dactylosporangium aurantiacum]